MLVTFSLSLEQFVSGFSQGTEFDGIRRFPDVDHYFSSQKTYSDNQRRFYTYQVC